MNGQSETVYVDTQKINKAVEKVLKPAIMVSHKPMVWPIIEEVDDKYARKKSKILQLLHEKPHCSVW